VFRRVSEGWTSLAVSAAAKVCLHLRCPREAAPNTSTGSAERNFSLVPLDCEDCSPRPRKSFVPRPRPFKMAGSRLAAVPVRRWLVPRAASTSLVFSFNFIRKARPDPPVHCKRKGSGAMAQGDHNGLAIPGEKVPAVARVPGVPPVRLPAPADRPSKFATSSGPPCQTTPSIFSAAPLLHGS
jgi:hypothetical protein